MPFHCVVPFVVKGSEGCSRVTRADGRAVGFFADGKLKRKDLAGGPPQVLADAPSARGGTWNLQGDIVFAPEATMGLKRVAATGGPAVDATELAADQGSHRWPQFLPDGRRFIFFVGLGQEGARGVYLGSLDGGQPKRLLGGETAALFAPPNHLLRVVKDASSTDSTSAEVRWTRWRARLRHRLAPTTGRSTAPLPCRRQACSPIGRVLAHGASSPGSIGPVPSSRRSAHRTIARRRLPSCPLTAVDSR